MLTILYHVLIIDNSSKHTWLLNTNYKFKINKIKIKYIKINNFKNENTIEVITY